MAVRFYAWMALLRTTLAARGEQIATTNEWKSKWAINKETDYSLDI